jgi:tRNA threonylcarbamoyladenosine biosynthesis protein TsaB
MGSLAVLSDEQPLAEDSWDERAERGPQVFRRLPGLLKRAGVGFDHLNLLAVGRGPGSYSGLRVALTTAQALALPSRTPVFAVSSGEALALEVLETDPARPVAIVGDARRESLWLGVFDRDGCDVRTVVPWTVLKPADLGDLVPAPCRMISPDAEKLSPLIAAHLRSGISWRAGDRFPRALWVGRLAGRRQRADRPSDPLTPIYMHPPVLKPAPDA